MALGMNPLLCFDNTSEKNFEKKLFNPFDFQQIMDDEGDDPDLTFLMINRKLLVCVIDEFSSSFNSLLKNSFSVLQINIRSKNFEKLM